MCDIRQFPCKHSLKASYLANIQPVRETRNLQTCTSNHITIGKITKYKILRLVASRTFSAVHTTQQCTRQSVVFLYLILTSTNKVNTSKVRTAAMLESVKAGRFITTGHLGLLEWDAGSPSCFLLETKLKIRKENASVNNTNPWL